MIEGKALAARSKVLPDPYFIQPGRAACQPAVPTMMAAYLRTGDRAAQRAAKGEIPAMKGKINGNPKRPQKKRKNAHENFRWCLQEQFPPYEVERAAGRIILIVGYGNYRPGQSSVDLQFAAHDPYGKFDPSPRSKQYDNRRMEGGACAASGGEIGPGQAGTLGANEVGRHKPEDPAVYSLLPAKRRQSVSRP